MKLVIQRVKGAALSVEGSPVSEIGAGLCIYVGVEKGDREQCADYLARKVAHMRIFSDENGKMNYSALDKGLEALCISQFTLSADCSRGHRPDFTAAEAPTPAEALYKYFGAKLSECGIQVKYGVFGADMTINQINDGPVTIILVREGEK